MVNEPLIGYEFAGTQTAVQGTGWPDVNNCVFDRCIAQDYVAGHDMVYGFFNISHKRLKFFQCIVWDITNPATQKTASVNVAAESIDIEGGIVNRPGGYFIDNSAIHRGNWIGSGNEFDIPRYGNIPLVNSTFVRNGRRFGGYVSAFSVTGYGLTGGAWTADATGTNTFTTFASTNNTIGRLFTTGTTTGNGAGIDYQILITCRQWDPVYKIRFRQNTTSLCRLFFGWKASTSTLPTGDDPLNATSGIMLCLRSADTNYQIASNDGTGATVFQNTGIAKNTAINTFELVAEDWATNKFKFSINNAAWVNVTTTTDIPAQTLGLCPVATIQTDESGVAKNFDIFDLYVETK